MHVQELESRKMVAVYPRVGELTELVIFSLINEETQTNLALYIADKSNC